MSYMQIYITFFAVVAALCLPLLFAMMLPPKDGHHQHHEKEPTNSGSHAGVLSSQITRLSNFKI